MFMCMFCFSSVLRLATARCCYMLVFGASLVHVSCDLLLKAPILNHVGSFGKFYIVDPDTTHIRHRALCKSADASDMLLCGVCSAMMLGWVGGMGQAPRKLVYGEASGGSVSVA